MLAEIGIESIEQLFSGIPEKLRLRRLLDLPKALTEPELLEYFQARAAKNSIAVPAFVGAGIYRHYIPIIIDALISRSEFYTAYTPYQAEIAQGTLQAIFEFQTYITQLTGMEVANASLYDGSTGLAEAVLMAHRISKKNTFLMPQPFIPNIELSSKRMRRISGFESNWCPTHPMAGSIWDNWKSNSTMMSRQLSSSRPIFSGRSSILTKSQNSLTRMGRSRS